MSSLLPTNVRTLAVPARMAAQTAVAALVAYAFVHITDMPEGTWAVISALFVVQQSVGGTLGAALGRLAGTALGTAIGLGCVLLIGADLAIRSAVSLVLAAVAIDFVAGLRPGVRYGVVPAAIIILGPGGDIVDTAWERAVAIGVGTVLGTLTALFVFPAPAHRSAERDLGEALRRCGDLLAATIAALIGQDRSADLDPIHEDIRRRLVAAEAMAAQSRYPRLRRWRRRWRLRATTPPPDDLLRAVERLWHTLILVDRTNVAGRPLPEGPLRHLAPALHGLAAASCVYLGRLGHAVARGEAPPRPDETRDRLGTLQRALDEARRREATRPLPSGEVERIFSLSFALEELARNFDEIAGLFDSADAAHGRAEAAAGTSDAANGVRREGSKS